MSVSNLNNTHDELELKQFSDIRHCDLNKYSIWVNCHGLDYNKSWYDQTDEETFRPWLKSKTIDPAKGIYLIKSTFTLSDGTTLMGFITPIPKSEGDKTRLLGSIQPHVFSHTNDVICFWFGMLQPSDSYIAKLYHLLGKEASSVFPVRFDADPGLSEGITSGTIPGFCYIGENGKVYVTR
jgi:hypothetical protein